MSHGEPCRAEGCYCDQLSYKGTAKNPVKSVCAPCYRARQPAPAPPLRSEDYVCYHTASHPVPTLGRDCYYCLAENLHAEQVFHELRYAPRTSCLREMLRTRLQGVYRYKSSCCGYRNGDYLCFCHFSEETVQATVAELLEKKVPGYKQWLHQQ